MLLQKTKEGGRGAATAMSCTRALSSAQKHMGFDTSLYRHLLSVSQGRGRSKNPYTPSLRKAQLKWWDEASAHLSHHQLRRKRLGRNGT